MTLSNLLEHNLSIPASENPHKVRQHMAYLCGRLNVHLKREYTWFADCTKAVEAGRWTGDRLRDRRLKLAKMIDACAEFLDEKSPIAKFPPNWEMVGLYYDYGAGTAFARARGSENPVRDGLNLALASHLEHLLLKQHAKDWNEAGRQRDLVS